jgi:hypothetical protein
MRHLRFGFLAAVFAATLVTASVAFAGGSPHFIAHGTGVSLSGSTLQCNFKEAGLSAGAVETVSCAGDEVTTYECVNNGGRNPSASNKTSTNTTFDQTGTFTADKNGNLVNSVTVNPAASTLSCPKGQTLTFVSVCYSNITITDTTSGATAGPFDGLCYTNPNAPQ